MPNHKGNNAGARFDPQQIKALQRNIDEFMKVTRAELPKVLRNTGRDFCFQAIKLTPKAKKIKVIPLYHNGKPIKNRQGKQIYIRMKQARSPKGTGFAKAGWVKALKGLGANVTSNWHQRSRKQALDYGAYTDRLKESEPWFLAVNKVPYIEDLDKQSAFFARTMNATIQKQQVILTKLAIKQASKWGKI